MFVNFKCHECGATFQIESDGSSRTKPVSCSSCGAKVSKKFIDQLEDFFIEMNSQPFEITFSDAPKIYLSDVSFGAHQFCKIDFKNIKDAPKASTVEDLKAILKSDFELEALDSVMKGAIYAYHQQLSQILERAGINIGLAYN